MPRIGTCISQRFISMMNNFGALNGWDNLLNILTVRKPDEKDLTMYKVSLLVSMISMCAALFHKSWADEHLDRVADAVKDSLVNASEKVFKDLKSEQISQIKISISNIHYRTKEREV